MILDLPTATTLLAVGEITAWYASSKLLGYVLIFIILFSPIYATIIASLVGRPRMLRTTGFFLGFTVAVFALLVSSVFILSSIIAFIIP